MTRISAMARSLGHTAVQALRNLLTGSIRAGAVPSSSRSSLSIADGCCAPGWGAPGWWAAGRVLAAMPAHLLAQPVGDLAGQLGHLDRVDPARPAPGHEVLVDHPAGPAAQHDHAVTEAHGLAHVVGDEQHRERLGAADSLQLIVQPVA